MKQKPWFKLCRVQKLWNYRMTQRPVKGKHCGSATVYRSFAQCCGGCGDESLPWFPSKLWFSFRCTDTAAWMLWVEKGRQPANNDCSKWRKLRGCDVRVALKCLSRCDCTTQLNSHTNFMQVLQTEEQRLFPRVTGQHRCFVRSNGHQCAHSEVWNTLPPSNLLVGLKIGHRGIQKGENNFNLAEQDNRTFETGSERNHQSAATVTTLVGWNLTVWEFLFSLQQ